MRRSAPFGRFVSSASMPSISSRRFCSSGVSAAGAVLGAEYPPAFADARINLLTSSDRFALSPRTAAIAADNLGSEKSRPMLAAVGARPAVARIIWTAVGFNPTSLSISASSSAASFAASMPPFSILIGVFVFRSTSSTPSRIDRVPAAGAPVVKDFLTAAGEGSAGMETASDGTSSPRRLSSVIASCGLTRRVVAPALVSTSVVSPTDLPRAASSSCC